jgi:hypothetical protein
VVAEALILLVTLLRLVVRAVVAVTQPLLAELELWAKVMLAVKTLELYLPMQAAVAAEVLAAWEQMVKYQMVVTLVLAVMAFNHQLLALLFTMLAVAVHLFVVTGVQTELTTKEVLDLAVAA